MSRFSRQVQPSPHVQAVQQLFEDFIKHKAGDEGVQWEEQVRGHAALLPHIMQHKNPEFLRAVCKIVPQDVQKLDASLQNLCAQQIGRPDLSDLERIKAIAPHAPLSTHNFVKRFHSCYDKSDAYELVSLLSPSNISIFVNDLYYNDEKDALNYLDLLDQDVEIDEALRYAIHTQNMDAVRILSPRATPNVFKDPLEIWYPEFVREGMHDSYSNISSLVDVKPYWDEALLIHQSLIQNQNLTLNMKAIQEKRGSDMPARKADRKI